MPTNPTRKGTDPAEGSRETINHELARSKESRNEASPRRRELAPGDEAAPGTPGTGEDICPECGGSGRIGTRPCANCSGSGRIIEGIGGA